MADAYFKWDNDFMTGHEDIDEQHTKLVDIINTLLQVSLDNKALDMEVIADLRQELEEYVVYHFQAEEVLMRESKVDSNFYEEHIRLHKAFVEKVKASFEDETSYNTAGKLGNVAEFLIRWLAYHVLNTDKSLARQLKAINEFGTSPEEAYSRELQHQESSTEPLLKALKVLYRLVSEKNKQIQAQNEDLERRVEERTKELQDANKKLEEMSYKDVLTGLPNRRYSMREMERLINQWERYGVPFSLLFIDIDKFKTVNDRCGHECGDKVLIWMAEYLVKNTRVTDMVCRLGGDEFLVLCPHTNEDEALVMSRKLSDITESLPLKNIDYWVPAISVGISTLNEQNKSASELLRKADMAMYKEKNK